MSGLERRRELEEGHKVFLGMGGMWIIWIDNLCIVFLNMMMKIKDREMWVKDMTRIHHLKIVILTLVLTVKAEEKAKDTTYLKA